jgi:glycosyltransferase involved in cell wall biosynthesis
MPIVRNDVTKNDRGGTAMMADGLEKRLIAAGRQDLLDFFDIYPSRVHSFDASRPSIYWLHDLPSDPDSEHLFENKYSFAAMVFVSNWQQQWYQNHYELKVNNQIVIPNAIEPFESAVLRKWNDLTLGTAANPLRLIYHTTPHRGLEFLVPAFEKLWTQMQARDFYMTLDVFSSFSIYGWDKRDGPYTAVFDACRAHPAITYHGAAPHSQVRAALIGSHLFAFPSIWPETSCLALMEAMSAGCLCLHSNYGVLPETSGGYTISYPRHPDNDLHFETFCRVFESTLLGIQSAIAQRRRPLVDQPRFAAERTRLLYNWNTRIMEWIIFLGNIKEQMNDKIKQSSPTDAPL